MIVSNNSSIYFDFNSYEDDLYINQKYEEIYQIAERTVFIGRKSHSL
jgi:antirestriction protein